MTIPTPDQSWVFETEKSHAGRLVSILSCDVNSSSSSPTDGPGTRSFTIVDTHQPALVFSTHPPSLLPPETLKYLTRVFRLDGTCADAGWLLHHPKMRALVCDPKCTNAEPSVFSYSLQPRDTGALTTPSAFHPSITNPPSPAPGTFALKTHPKSIAALMVEALSCREKSNNEAVACCDTCNCVPKALCEFRASESTATHLLHVIYSPAEGLFRWGVTATSRATAALEAGHAAGSTTRQAWAHNFDYGEAQPQDYALLCAGGCHIPRPPVWGHHRHCSMLYVMRHTSAVCNPGSDH